MKVTLLGTGMVARVLTERLRNNNHQVTLGTRDVEAKLSSQEPGAYGTPAFPVWYANFPEVKLVQYKVAAEGADLIINATKGLSSLETLKSMGEDTLAGKILLDLSNPLDFSNGMPPTLAIVNTDSLAEQIQKALPKTKVVKTLNTLNAGLMLDPGQLGEAEHDIFLSGNDEDAKAKVVEFLKSFGWKHIIDLGDITTARGTEMLLPVWVRLYAAFGHANFNFRIVKD